jgi:cell division inhibitor SepF
MHRMGVYLGLVEEDDYEPETYGDVDGPATRREDYTETREKYAREFPRESARSDVATYPRTRHEYSEETFVEPRVQEMAPTYQITALHPRTYNEARAIGEHFRRSTPVIMNLSDMDDADAKRLVDFAAGLTFGLHGRLERVTAKVFLLSPNNVTVTAQDKAKIENGFFNQS